MFEYRPGLPKEHEERDQLLSAVAATGTPTLIVSDSPPYNGVLRLLKQWGRLGLADVTRADQESVKNSATALLLPEV